MRIRFETFQLIVLAIVLTSVAGLRVLGYDKDYDSYWNMYYGYSRASAEPGFNYLMWLAFNAGLSFETYLLLWAAGSLSIKSYIFSREPLPVLGLAIYALALLPLHEMTQIRMAMALSFAMLAFEFRSRNGYMWFLSFPAIVVAYLLHSSTIMFAPFIIFWPIFLKKSIGLAISVFFSSFIFLLFIDSELVLSVGNVGDHIEFASEYVKQNLFSVRSVLSVVFAGIAWYGFKDLPLKTRPWLYVFVFGIGCFVLLNDYPVVSGRMFEGAFIATIFLAINLKGRTQVSALGVLLIIVLYTLWKMLVEDRMFG